MLTLKATGSRLDIIVDELIPSGSIGRPVRIEFDEDWAQYSKTIVFRNQTAAVDEVHPSAGTAIETVIPASIIHDPCKLQIGVYGSTADTATPTIYSPWKVIPEGAIPSGIEPPEDPTVIEQILDILEHFSGGSSSQKLVKASDEDFEVEWADETEQTWEDIKPEGGVPKTDLASAVQASLDLADTALQDADLTPYRTAAAQDLIDEGIVSAFADYRTAAAQDLIDLGKVDKEAGKGLSHNDYDDTAKGKVDDIPPDPKYTDTVYDDTAIKARVSTIEGMEAGWSAKYDKPSGGIPKADLAESVQESLSLADTALQEHQSLDAYRTAIAQDAIDDTKANNEDLAHDSTMQLVNNALVLIAKAKGASTTPTIRQMQRNIRAGLGPTMYPVGYQFATAHSVYGTIVWQVTGHNQVQSATGKQYTMTCVSKYRIANVQFDAFEAIFANANTSALAAGNYSFVLNGVRYYFTTTVAIPVGGQICKSAGGAYTPTELKSYASPESTTALETITPSTTAIAGAADLGTSGTGNINHHHRTWYGSNNYKESAIRQFLNSDSAAGSVWSPQTKFDRPPTWAQSLAGFMNSLPAEFIDAVDIATVKCSANNTYESTDSSITKNTAYVLADKFWLPSRFEIHGTSDVVDNSVLMSYYSGASNIDRIKLLNGSAGYWWLRTPNSGIASNVRVVGPNGSLDSGANNSYGCVPACIIS